MADDILKVLDVLKEPAKEPVEKQEIAVAWTGGFDSTAVLLKYLTEGYRVYTISAIIENNPSQNEAEKHARERLLKLIKEKHDNNTQHGGELAAHHEFTIPLIDNTRHMQFIQPYLWLTSIPIRCKQKQIALGYVKADDFWHAKEHAQKTQDALCGFCYDTFEYVYPFEYHSKDDILEVYQDWGHLFPYLSVCESGSHWMTCNIQNCIKCKPMRRLWAKFNKYDLHEPIYKKEAKPRAKKSKQCLECTT